MTQIAEQLYDELVDAFNEEGDLRNAMKVEFRYTFEEEGPIFSKVPNEFFHHSDEFPSEIPLKSGLLKIGDQTGDWTHGHMVFQEYKYLGHLFVAAAEYNSWDVTEWQDEFIEVVRVERSRIGTLYEEVRD